MLVLALTLLPLLTRPAYADGVVGDGTPESCTEDALHAAVVQGGMITFNCGDSPHTIAVSDEIVVAEDTTIDGGGTAQGGLITLSGGQQTRVLRSENRVNLTVQNLTIRDGKEPGDDGSGGGIFGGWRSTLTVKNCIFENNDGTSGNQEHGGGAIFIKSESTLVVEDCLFRNNRGINGGAINNLLSSLTVERSVFEENDTTAGAGGEVTSGYGSAIYTDGASAHDGTTAGTITIRDCVFRNNVGAGQGGAVFTFVYPPDTVVIERSTFADNLLIPNAKGDALGGGLRHGNGELTLRDSTFVRNVARSQGGAFWTDGNHPATLTNVTFVENQAVEDPDTGEGGLGGAIAGGGNLSCTNCTIAQNHAGFIGGGIFGDNNITLKNTLVVSNTAYNSGKGWDKGHNCSAELNDGGGNMQIPPRNPNDSTDSNCTASITIITTDDPILLPLADNGGSTQTMALADGSPAIDTGTDNGCPATDQRGVARPQDGDGDGTAQCDSGSYEWAAEGNPTPTATTPISPTATPLASPTITPTPDPNAIHLYLPIVQHEPVSSGRVRIEQDELFTFAGTQSHLCRDTSQWQTAWHTPHYLHLSPQPRHDDHPDPRCERRL